MKSLSLLALASILSLGACSDDPVSPDSSGPCEARMRDEQLALAMSPHSRAVTRGTEGGVNFERWAITWQSPSLAPIAVTFRWGGSLQGCVVQVTAA